MEFRILGPLEVRDGGRVLGLGGAKQRAILALLVLHANQTVSRDRLIDSLWPEDPPGTAANALQVGVHKLRRILEPDRPSGAPGQVLVTRPPGYVLRVAPEQVDLQKYERLAEVGMQALTKGEPARAAAVLRDALSLWRGEPLADVAYVEFAQVEIRRLEESRLAVLEARINAELALGRHRELIGMLERLVGDNPLRERLRYALMLALYRSGRQAEALTAYREGRRVLTDELGIEPSAELRTLERRILSHDPELNGADLLPGEPPTPASQQAERVITGGQERGTTPGFVGRAPELGNLVSAFERAEASSGRVILIAGEPGIGKTRLVDEAALVAEKRGARLLRGRSWEAGGAPPYWPWMQALQAYVREAADVELQRTLGIDAGHIVQLVPEIAHFAAVSVAATAPADPERARFLLLAAAAGFIRRAAEPRPLVLLLEDLHAADASSLLLLRFLAREISSTRVLVLGTYRDIEVGPEHPFRSALGELSREPAVAQLQLTGMSRHEVGQLLATIGRRVPTELTLAAIHRETRGNPLFVSELVKVVTDEDLEALAAHPSRANLPVTAREAISHRLSELPAACKPDLQVASVLGQEFSLTMLAAIVRRSADSVLDSLAPAISGGLLQATSSLDRLVFAHSLIREATYGDLTTRRRRQLHERAARALEDLYCENPGQHLSELAHHFFEAGPAAEPKKTIEYATHAADQATAAFAYEESVRFYEMALEALRREPGDYRRTRCTLLLGLGDAYSRAGALPEANDAFRRAAEVAAEAGWREELARAAIGYGSRFGVWARSTTDPHLVPLLHKAADLTAGQVGHVRAQILARLAAAMRADADDERRTAVSNEAVELAREAADKRTLAYAIAARCAAQWSPETAHTRSADATEVIALARETDDREREFEGHMFRLFTSWELGDLPTVDDEMSFVRQLADELRLPAHRWMVTAIEAMRALSDGRLDAAGGLIEHALQIGTAAQSWNAVATHTVQTFLLLRERGELHDLEPQLLRSPDRYPSPLVFQCIAAHVAAHLGQGDRARGLLDELAARKLSRFHRDEEWLFAISLLPEVCAKFEDPRRAAVIYELLLPYGHLNAVAPPEAAFGSTARGVGLLAATMGLWDEAVQYFEQALSMNASMAALPSQAHTQHDYARMLLARGTPADREAAERLLDAAIAAYQQLGMTPWARAADALRAAVPRHMES